MAVKPLPNCTWIQSLGSSSLASSEFEISCFSTCAISLACYYNQPLLWVEPQATTDPKQGGGGLCFQNRHRGFQEPSDWKEVSLNCFPPASQLVAILPHTMDSTGAILVVSCPHLVLNVTGLNLWHLSKTFFGSTWQLPVSCCQRSQLSADEIRSRKTACGCIGLAYSVDPSPGVSKRVMPVWS